MKQQGANPAVFMPIRAFTYGFHPQSYREAERRGLTSMSCAFMPNFFKKLGRSATAERR
ncbi:hypothetical protein [Treponema endosymbiont of Eucomonympha sp.]|uniref:hypothetical protein n=1 Tax=Treponema endosymbiont of Eucomonympha sp. TaxID=1580831 RepID=UPI000B1C7EE7|nr:hypothetical protein [Treponema endosymbiont of Eucomonympha sp.]